MFDVKKDEMDGKTKNGFAFKHPPSSWPFSFLAIRGKVVIREAFVKLANMESRGFSTEPYWDEADDKTLGYTQSLTFTFIGGHERKLEFLTSEIEQYASCNPQAVAEVDARLQQLLE